MLKIRNGERHGAKIWHAAANSGKRTVQHAACVVQGKGGSRGGRGSAVSSVSGTESETASEAGDTGAVYCASTEPDGASSAGSGGGAGSDRMLGASPRLRPPNHLGSSSTR